MSGTDDDAPRIEIATILRGSDGRVVVVDVLPEPDGDSDLVLVWDAASERPVWIDPRDLGFTPVPMIIDVPVLDGSGQRIVEGDGTVIVCNVPSSGN